MNNLFEIASKVNGDMKNKFELARILDENQSTFARDSLDLGKLLDTKHDINTIDEDPVSLRPYRVPHSQEKVVDNEIN